MSGFGGCWSLPSQALCMICVCQTGRAPGRSAVPTTSCAQPTCLSLFWLGDGGQTHKWCLLPAEPRGKGHPVGLRLGSGAGRGRGSKRS